MTSIAACDLELTFKVDTEEAYALIEDTITMCAGLVCDYCADNMPWIPGREGEFHQAHRYCKAMRLWQRLEEVRSGKHSG